MLKSVALATLILATLMAAAVPTPNLIVNCDAGQSVMRTLARLDKSFPITVTVKGTCTEYVFVDGFENLTLKGAQGATLQQPSTAPPENPGFVLSIRASRSITVTGLTVRSSESIFSCIGIERGSSDIFLSDVSTDGAWGVIVDQGSQAWLTRVTVNVAFGFAGISAFDKSDVHIVDGLVKHSADSSFRAGILVDSGHVTMQGTTIRDMQQGISIGTSGSVDLVNFEPTAAGIDVMVDNPAGTNFNGVIVSDGSSLNLSSAKLRITNPGQPFSGDTAGVFVTNGSTLNAGANLIVSGSQSQGVIVSNNSHAQLAGSSITGSAHGGLVVVNLSTAGADNTNPLTVVSGNGTDLFCDSKSQIAGGANIANAATVQCNNLLPGPYENLP